MLAAGAALMLGPLLFRLCRDTWGTSEGAYGPVVAITAIWLIVRMTPAGIAAPDGRSRRAGYVVFAGGVSGYVIALRLGMLGPACVGAYAALIGVYALRYGWLAVRYAWFPITYLLLCFPLPELVTLPLGQALKLHLSQAATDLLSAAGLPVANTGVVIYVRQYELLVRSACSGMNSLIGLSAVGTFYAYVAHHGRIPWWFVVLIPTIAVTCNLARVLVLVIAAYLFGSAVINSTFHDAIALATYVVALALVFATDRLCTRWRDARMARIRPA